MPKRRLSFRFAYRTCARRLSAFAAALACCLGNAVLPVSALPAGYYRCHPNGEGKIALTFDDGPHPVYTAQILEVLAAYNVPATFFVIGENVSAYPELVEAECRAGHEIGNHTFSHPGLHSLSCARLAEEMERCEDVIGGVLDTAPKLFRPPQGVLTEELETLARKKDYSVILWDVDTMDWAGTPAEEIYANVMTNTKSGDIILMHDYHGKKCHTLEALQRLIPALQEKGFTFVTVSELLGSA